MSRALNYLLLAALLLAVLASFRFLQIDLGELTSRESLRQMGDYASGFLRPDFSAAHLAAIGRGALETLAMSAVGTLLAALLGLLLALPAAGRCGALAQHATRLLLNALRAIPELVWAALMVLAAGLGPGQAEAIAQEPAAVQATINAVRPFTLAAVTAQNRRFDSFATTFLRDALSGTDSDFDGQRGRPSVTILNPQVTLGTFVRTGEVSGIFVPDDTPTPIPISIDYDNRTISINGESGISNNAGLSGNNAAGTVILPGGRVIRVEVFGTRKVIYGSDPPRGFLPDLDNMFRNLFYVVIGTPSA